MLIPLPVLMMFESVVNGLLSLDPEAESLLSTIEGKVIAVNITSLDATVYLIVVGKGIEITRVHDTESDLTMSGSIPDLLALLKSPGNLTDGTVAIDGDIAIAKKLKAVADTLDIDWEGHLSNVIGDTPSHHIFRAASTVQAAFGRGIERVEQRASDWVKNDGAVAVSPEELDEFCTDVDSLRSDVDRLEARLNRLEQ